MKLIRTAALVAVGASLFGAYAFAQVELEVGAKAPNFSAMGTDGQTHSLASLTKTGGVYLYFIQIGCPVNHRAAPHFNKISATYGTKANMVGIINGSAADAKAWAKEYGAKFTILADKDMKIIKAYGAQHSPWATAVSKDGKVSKVWNSGSPSTLTALNKMAAQTAGKKMATLSFDGAPSGGG